MIDNQKLREHLIWLLEGGDAHASVENVIGDFPRDFAGVKPPKFPHTAWQILEHMRIVQWDILQFCLNSAHISPKFPQGYWPQHARPNDIDEWDRTAARFRDDFSGIIEMVNDFDIDLLALVPHGSGQTYLREVLLVADHNAYHLGQLVTLRRMLDIWPS